MHCSHYYVHTSGIVLEYLVNLIHGPVIIVSKEAIKKPKLSLYYLL